MKKNYWKGHEELQQTPAFQKSKKQEFQEELPLLHEMKQVAADTQGSRRDFLKVLGFSLGAATVAASCEIPVKYAIPYANKPEEVLPGIANYYASSFINGSDYCSVLVKTREGRPIKIEGNPLSSISQGGTSARAQASVVSLYDGARLRFPKIKGKKATWAAIDKEVPNKFRAAAGRKVLLTGPIISPTLRKAIEEFTSATGAEHIVYEAVSKGGILTANEKSFGKRVVPGYDFKKADVIVSFGADFLGTWVSPVEFTKQYTSRRHVDKDHPAMSRHWQFEQYMSLTGANADKRLTVKPSQLGMAVAALYNEVVGGGGSVKLDAKVMEGIKKAAKDLKAASGKSIVVCGSNDPNVQEVVNAINESLGNYGQTIDLDKNYTAFGGDDKKVKQLVADMNAGKVGGLIVHGVNPAYSYPEKGKFASGLKKVATSISFNDREDETAENITYLCPNNHYLESWSDAEPKKGSFSLGQPAISPLFDTRQAGETLLRWAGNNTTYYDYLKQNWESAMFGQASGFGSPQAFWDVALHNGVFEVGTPVANADAAVYTGGKARVNSPAPRVPSIQPQETKVDTIVVAGSDEQLIVTNNSTDASVPATRSAGNVSAALSAITSAKASGIELAIYENPIMGDGRYANNPFLQETPEPITKICWDNAISVSQHLAEEKGWKEYDLVKVTANGHEVTLPVIIQYGQAAGTAAISVGYGRTKAGSKLCNVGQNVYPFVGTKGDAFDYNVTSGVTIEKVGRHYALPRTQTHHTVDDTGVLGNDRPIVREAVLDEYKKDKYAGNHVTEHFKHNLDKHFFTLYGEDDAYGPHADLFERGHHWGMSVDLTTCTGCSACVTACNIENNVPIVGANEVFRAHEMHWMRIDRYFSGDRDHPDVTFMPMMCQHCDNAPCENVCPVAATNHSSEGINQMAYNRCIGTRYCANNCPFKVRRFNWFDYQGADSFYKDTIFDNDEWVLVNDLSRMVLNPDVTVRSRGVMEKCSFCVQRVQEGKLTAKREGRPLKDGEVQTACQTACPANAIVFGDLNDKDSAVSKLFKNERTYKLLDEIHVLSSIGYMTHLRNRDADPHKDGHGGHVKGHKQEHG